MYINKLAARNRRGKATATQVEKALARIEQAKESSSGSKGSFGSGAAKRIIMNEFGFDEAEASDIADMVDYS